MSAPQPSRRGARGAVLAVMTGLVVLLVGAGCAVTGSVGGSDEGAGSDDQGSTGEGSDRPTSTPVEELIPGKTIGTPDNPYSPGDTVVIEDWTFTLGATDTDAWPEIIPELKKTYPTIFNDFAPEPGMHYVTAPLTFTYTGPTDTQDRANGFDATHVAADGTETRDGSCGEYSSSSGDYFDSNATWSEPSEEGVLCAQVPPERADSGQWRLSLFFWDHEGNDRLIEVYYTAG